MILIRGLLALELLSTVSLIIVVYGPMASNAAELSLGHPLSSHTLIKHRLHLLTV